MKISEATKQYVIKTRFDIEEVEGLYFIFREPTEDELIGLGEFSNDNIKVQKHILNNVLPACLIEHNLEDDEGKILNKKDALDFLKLSGKKTNTLLQNWFSSFTETETLDVKKKE